MHKISIVSRGQALGYTISLPSEDRYLTTKSTLMEQMAMTLGGRAAEELVFHEVTTGAANDLERVTSTAKQMIMRFGMSEKLGPRVLGRNHDLPFLGREMGAEPDYSDEIAKEIDDEIRRVIEESHDKATHVLREHMEELHKLSAILIERETVDREQFERLLAGRGGGIGLRGGGHGDARARARGGGRQEAGAEAVTACAARRCHAAAAAIPPPPDVVRAPWAGQPAARRPSGSIRPLRAVLPAAHVREHEHGADHARRGRRAGRLDRDSLDAKEIGEREERDARHEGRDPEERQPRDAARASARLVR